MILSSLNTVYMPIQSLWEFLVSKKWQSTLIFCLWYFYFRNEGLVPMFKKRKAGLLNKNGQGLYKKMPPANPDVNKPKRMTDETIF